MFANDVPARVSFARHFATSRAPKAEFTAAQSRGAVSIFEAFLAARRSIEAAVSFYFHSS